MRVSTRPFWQHTHAAVDRALRHSALALALLATHLTGTRSENITASSATPTPGQAVNATGSQPLTLLSPPSASPDCSALCEAKLDRVVFASLFGAACLIILGMCCFIARFRSRCRDCGKRRAKYCALGSDAPHRCDQCRRQSDRRLDWSCADCEWRTVNEAVTVARRSVTVFGFPVDAVGTWTAILQAPGSHAAVAAAPDAELDAAQQSAPGAHTDNPLHGPAAL